MGNPDTVKYVKKIVYNKYISPFESDKHKCVGVELEFPLLNMRKNPVDTKLVNGLMEHIISMGCGFELLQRDMEGNIAAVENDHGDVISFDNSYNNIEFSMAKAITVAEIAYRFYGYFNSIQRYLMLHDYIITGLGTNPYKRYINDSPVKISIYNAIRGYLFSVKGSQYHKYSYFPSYISSVQTHIDLKPNEITMALNLYAKLDFVRALLFSNSLPFEDSGTQFAKYICYRDFLWEMSGFSYNPLNVGKYDLWFGSIDDIVNSYLPRSIFYRKRNETYEHFTPVPLIDYFSDEKHGALPEDIQSFISFHTIELTARGTLEIRSDCAQPLKTTFAPAAFNQGLSLDLIKTKQLCDAFFEDNNIKFKNSELRNFIVSGEIIPRLDRKKLSEFILNLIDISYNALLQFSRGDETFLLPLYKRAETLAPPVLDTISALKSNNPIEDIIYANSLL